MIASKEALYSNMETYLKELSGTFRIYKEQFCISSQKCKNNCFLRVKSCKSKNANTIHELFKDAEF